MNTMKRRKYLLDFDLALLQSIVFYILLAILLVPHYQYQINPDGVNYISIAQKYMHLDYPNAINGYWGPLLSWLLVPFLFLGLKPLLAVKLLSLIIGAVTIIQSNSLIKKFTIDGSLRNVLLYLIAVIVIYFSLIVITPDLLFLCLSLAFINIVLDSSYINSKYAGVISGALGSGLYLAKSYGFPFFIVNFFIVNLIFYFRIKNRHNRARILSHFIAGIVVFSLISTCWIAIISNKYGQLTIGTAGSYNHAIIGPQFSGIRLGLNEPSNNTAISFGEDPSYLKIQSWSIFDSISSLKYQMKIALNNVYRIIYYLAGFSVLSLVLLAIAAVYLLMKGKQMVTDNIFFLIVSLVILFSGYAMISVENRLLWLSDILIIIIGAKLLDLLFKKILLKKISKIILIGIFVTSFALPPLIKLYCSLDTGKDIFDLNNKINYLNIHGRIASNGTWKQYQTSLYLSFYNGWQYWGNPDLVFRGERYIPPSGPIPQDGEREKLGELELKTQLENKMIDYYFVWKPFDEKMKFLDRYEDITDGRLDELRIYKLK
jgi:hypothetical protein